jgi:adenine phosphoribosyltransferase
MDYEKYIVVNGFPKAGISFKDISPLLRDPKAFHQCIDDFAKLAEPYHPTVILGPESRGFIFGAAFAYKMGIGFVMARKAGKLPGMTASVSYTLEYGTATLKFRSTLFKKGDRVFSSMISSPPAAAFKAMEDLTKKLGADPVAALVVIYLKELQGEKALDIPLHSLVSLSAVK